MLSKLRNQKGFTLIEVIVVIALLAILATIVLVAINPAQNSQDARNTKRRSDILEILNAVNQYYVANGAWPTNMPAAGASAAIKGAAVATAGDICSSIVPTYIAALPYDPSAAAGGFNTCVGVLTGTTSGYTTNYTIALDASGKRVTISAPSAEGTTISVTR